MDSIAIYVVYAPDGIIYDYVIFGIESIKKVAERVIIVVNGNIENNEEKKLSHLNCEVYMRDNRGFDGGAYKDMVLNYLTEVNWNNVRRLILLNDTFYGPFWPWEHYFEMMDLAKADFWGLSKYKKSSSAFFNGRVLPEHLQGYFIVINNTILKSDAFIEFWGKMDEPESYKQTILNYEVELTSFFSSLGYSYSSYLDMNGDNKYLQPSECIYSSKPYSLINEFKFPILKRKACNAFNEEILAALRYIDTSTEYDINNIYGHLDGLKVKSGISISDIRTFCENHEHIYIYGKGKFGRILKKNLDDLGYQSSSFVVSDSLHAGNDNGVVCFDELELKTGEGIIVALGDANLKEVIQKVQCRVNREHLLLPDWNV